MQKQLLQFAMFSVLTLALCSQGFAQGVDNGNGNGGGGTGDNGGAFDGNTGNTQDLGNTTGGGGGSTVDGNDGVVGDEPNVELELEPDNRNQGFVGATAPLIQDGRETEDTSAFRRNAGFIGAASDTSGPTPVDGATFGGGVNDVNGSFSGGGGAGGGRAGFGANEVGFPVTRRSVRAKLRPNFYAPRLAPQVVTSRFNDHFSTQPGSRSMSGNYSITVQDRTAFIAGVVSNQYESQRLERQLRLEPGVYKIVNQLRVTN